MKKEHILVMRFSALGDVAMTVPVVYSMAMAYPDVRITVLSRGFARAFFEDLAPNVSFMEADLKGEYRGVSGLNKLYRRLVAKNFTAVADMHSVLRSDYLRLRFNISFKKVAHIDKHRRMRARLVARKNKVLQQLPTSFENYTEVLNKLGYRFPLVFRSLFPEEGGDLSLLPEAILTSAAAGEAQDGDSTKAPTKPAGEKWIGIAPFAAHQGKVYPIEKMRRVIASLTERYSDARLFLFGRGEQEDEVFPQWCQEFKQCTHVGPLLESMRQELILMSHLDVMLSMDSANMHMASLCAVPVVSVWGATHPFAGFMGWRQSADNVVEADMPCRPCSVFGNKPCMHGDYPCLNNIRPETIVSKIVKVMEAK